MAAASDHSRPLFVLDCSVALSWCFPDERSATSDAMLSALTHGSVVVPPLWFLEVSNALLAGERRKRLRPIESLEALELLADLPIEVDDRLGFPLSSDLLILARTKNLSSYDSAYLELARRRGLPLATLDRDLQKAAKSMGLALAA